MHPFITHLSEKDRPTLEECAIVGMSRILDREELPDYKYNEYTTYLSKWLRELNPHHLSGPELGDWVATITEEYRGRET